jgi:hypothetical protein
MHALLLSDHDTRLYYNILSWACLCSAHVCSAQTTVSAGAAFARKKHWLGRLILHANHQLSTLTWSSKLNGVINSVSLVSLSVEMQGQDGIQRQTGTAENDTRFTRYYLATITHVREYTTDPSLTVAQRDGERPPRSSLCFTFPDTNAPLVSHPLKLSDAKFLAKILGAVRGRLASSKSFPRQQPQNESQNLLSLL